MQKIMTAVHWIRKFWWRVAVPLRLRLAGVIVGKEVKFYGMPSIYLAANSRIVIMDRAIICSVSGFTALGVNHPVILRTLNPGSEIIIGPDSGISGGVLCAAKSISIGAECLIGANATIIDTDFHPIASFKRRFVNDPQAIATEPVLISDNVFVGAGAVVLKGVTIGRNSVVGASSIVTRSIPANSVAAGSPAKIISRLE